MSDTIDFDKAVGYALVKYNIVLTMAVYQSDEDFKLIENLLYEDPFHPKDAVWIRIPDHNKAIAKRYVYNEKENFFHEPQPFPSWTLDLEKQCYVPPIDFPEYPLTYDWNEEKLDWDITGKITRVDTIDNLLEDLENE